MNGTLVAGRAIQIEIEQDGYPLVRASVPAKDPEFAAPLVRQLVKQILADEAGQNAVLTVGIGRMTFVETLVSDLIPEVVGDDMYWSIWEAQLTDFAETI